MPYIKPLIDDRWIVYNDIGNYAGLLIKTEHEYAYYRKRDTSVEKSQIVKFLSHKEMCDYFGEDIMLNEVRKRNGNGNGGVISEIKGYPLNFDTPIMVEHESLPLFKKSSASDVVYCAGFYCVKGPEGWRKSFCPKRHTLESIDDWEGPFNTELEMISVLNIKKKEHVE